MDLSDPAPRSNCPPGDGGRPEVGRRLCPTVPRVLNGGDYVAATTRERVLKAISLLGYKPNVAARTLVTGRSRMIGVASYDTTLRSCLHPRGDRAGCTLGGLLHEHRHAAIP